MPGRGLRSPPQCPHPSRSGARDQRAARGPLDPRPRRGADSGPSDWTGWGGGAHFPAVREGAAGRWAERASSLSGPPRLSRRTCALHSPRGPVSPPPASLSAIVARPRPGRGAYGAAPVRVRVPVRVLGGARAGSKPRGRWSPALTRPPPQPGLLPGLLPVLLPGPPHAPPRRAGGRSRRAKAARGRAPPESPSPTSPPGHPRGPVPPRPASSPPGLTAERLRRSWWPGLRGSVARRVQARAGRTARRAAGLDFGSPPRPAARPLFEISRG